MSNIYSANTDTIFQTLANHIFKNYGKKIGDAATKKNFAIAYLDTKGKKIEAGGLDFTETIMTTENSNFGFRDHYAQIDANIQDPTKTLSFDPKTLSGTLVMNEKHTAMNQGRSAIKSLVKTLKMQADTTIKNQMNAAMWTSSPGAEEPESIRSLVPDDPTSGTIGGVNRASSTWARSYLYDTAVSDIGTEAGLAALHTVRRSLGGDAKMVPDFGVTTVTNYGALEGYLDSNNRRIISNADMTKLGHDNIMLGKTTVGYDGDGAAGECPTDHFYFLNSEVMFMKILQGKNFVFDPFSKKDNSLNNTSIFRVMYNITTCLPSALGVLTSISVA